jgi:hypothetical protein
MRVEKYGPTFSNPLNLLQPLAKRHAEARDTNRALSDEILAVSGAGKAAICKRPD